ncbi:MAG TPA: porin [Kofleriaceae bacterium]|nr:porin [Kofleriaceae bacterium]
MARRIAGLLVLAGWCAAALPAVAAPPDPVEAVRRRLDELNRTLSEVPAALEALHDVENRVSALQREVERLAASRAADPDVRQAVDALRTQLAELDRRLAETQLRLRERAPATPLIGYDDGIALRTDPVDVTVNMGVQGRYTATLRPSPAPNGSTFDLHHAQLWLRSTALGFIDLSAMFDFGLEFARQGGAAMVRDLFLAVRPLPWLRIRAGQFKVPFARQHLVYSLKQTFIERSFAMLAFRLDRDLGGMVEACVLSQRLLIQLAVTDGIAAGAQVRNDNQDLAYTVRVVAQPLGPMGLVEGDRARTPKPRLSFGGAFQYDLEPTDQPAPLNDLDRKNGIDNVEVISANAELAFKWRGLAVEGEYFYRQERAGFGRPTRAYHGVYGQLSMMVWRGLEGAVRFSWAQVPPLRAPPIGLLGPAPRAGLEAGAAVNYYLWGERVKAQVAYVYRKDSATDPFDPRLPEAHIIDVQLQAGF